MGFQTTSGMKFSDFGNKRMSFEKECSVEYFPYTLIAHTSFNGEGYNEKRNSKINLSIKCLYTI